MIFGEPPPLSNPHRHDGKSPEGMEVGHRWGKGKGSGNLEHGETTPKVPGGLDKGWPRDWLSLHPVTSKFRRQISAPRNSGAPPPPAPPGPGPRRGGPMAHRPAGHGWAPKVPTDRPGGGTRRRRVCRTGIRAQGVWRVCGRVWSTMALKILI